MPKARYKNLSGNSGVTAFDIRPDAIVVWFEDDQGYEYDTDRPGAHYVEEMKRRAQAGRGLATYINQHVRDNYARQLPES